MTVKYLQEVFKTENCNPNAELKIKISIQKDEDTWVTELVPIESYFIQKDGTVHLGCCVWNDED